MLAWSVKQLRNSMGPDLQHAMEAIRWSTDYFIKATNTPNVVYAQVGNAEGDHNCLERPEDMDTPRTTFAVTAQAPGSEVSAEISAALAAASMVFKLTDPAYSKFLINRAVQPLENDSSDKKDDIIDELECGLVKSSHDGLICSEDPLQLHIALPVFTFANQAGLDMLETTLVALQDITLEKIFDDHGKKNLCTEFPQIMQQDGLICSEDPLQLHISASVMDTFMKLAKSNTNKNLETCGVLAGSLVCPINSYHCVFSYNHFVAVSSSTLLLVSEKPKILCHNFDHSQAGIDIRFGK
ncbi:hypothetical protein K7X08_035089 [Anisodus acutangulus]|uniref:cellulase n=1 Tax=Anisodus acutangulus TaxID=402998 RepID=A0A9Q1R291_9SOLA|nr:hypothetical protein K7X08_035089 [Anisodus acutangulus]